MTFLEEQKRRIDNINAAEEKNKKYFRRTRIRDYLPGQVTYGLGDYPARISAAPTEYDYNLLKQMADTGVRLVQVHEEWNDAVRLYGADKFHAPDHEGMKQFIELCHSLGMKVLAYVSSGYFQENDPDFREEFTRPKGVNDKGETEYHRLLCTSNYFNYRMCWCGSREWRSYIIPRTFQVMEEYGFDGIFNDWGYDGKMFHPHNVPLPYDPELEDMLGILYHGVKSRGGIYKLNADRNNQQPCKDKVYDYLWIGEGVSETKPGTGKDYPDYVVPCVDLNQSKDEKDAYMARTIPYLQFPLLKYGRPVLGNNQNLPGVTYYGGGEQDFYNKVHDYMEKNPDGPYVYSLWSAIPDDPTEYPHWLEFLKLYLPMVTENTLAYIELSESEYIKLPLSENVCASMFVNEDIHMAFSNFADKPYELVLEGEWIERRSGKRGSVFTVDSKNIVFLVKQQ